jgi:hypothetical protein
MNTKDVKIKSTIPFKLKNTPERCYKMFDLELQFGFIPKHIIINRPYGQHNTFILSAIIPKEEKKK